MKCKDCIFYTGIKCHGHNDYWGDCIIIEKLYEIYKNKNKNFSKINLFNYICYDDTNCKYNKFINDIYTRGIISEKDFKILSSKEFKYKCFEIYNFNKWLKEQINILEQ